MVYTTFPKSFCGQSPAAPKQTPLYSFVRLQQGSRQSFDATGTGHIFWPMKIAQAVFIPGHQKAATLLCSKKHWEVVSRRWFAKHPLRDMGSHRCHVVHGQIFCETWWQNSIHLQCAQWKAVDRQVGNRWNELDRIVWNTYNYLLAFFATCSCLLYGDGRKGATT